ncbi:mCG147272 [Mus musculus]|nr:mCG147272 [Mus musculus]
MNCGEEWLRAYTAPKRIAVDSSAYSSSSYNSNTLLWPPGAPALVHTDRQTDKWMDGWTD